MNKKKIKVLTIAVLAIIALIAVPSIIRNIKKNEVKPVVEKWVIENNISGVSIEEVSHTSDWYDITIRWNGFENLSPSEMRKVVKNWESFPEPYTTMYYLRYIVSNGNRYSIDSSGIYSYKDMKTIVSFKSYSYSSESSSSTSNKTATCNYCNGKGKVNGETCPWCNGSGKTYDNSFNDMLK